MRRIGWVASILLILLLVAGCARGGQAGLSVEITAPATGATVPTGREVVISSTTRGTTGTTIERVELHVNGELIREDAPTGTDGAAFSIEQRWVPPAAGTAQVEVIAYDSQGRASTPATLTLTVQGSAMATTAPFPTRAPTTVPVTPTTTPFPSPAPLPSTTPTTAVVASVEIAGTINTDANIRNGPGPTFDRVDGLYTGAAVTAIGRNEASDWVKIRYGSGQTGWVLRSLGGWQGDVQMLAVLPN